MYIYMTSIASSGSSAEQKLNVEAVAGASASVVGDLTSSVAKMLINFLIIKAKRIKV